MDSAGKRKSQMEPAHAPPLQARVAAANRTVLTTNLRRSWRTWTEQGGGPSKMNGGKNVEGSGHGMAKASRHTKPAEQATAGGHSRQMVCPAQASTKTTTSSWPASQQTTAADDVGRPLAVQCRLVEGVRWCWPLRRRAQTYLPTCLPPTYCLCLSLYIPTPLI